jgi:hypothetical protein
MSSSDGMNSSTRVSIVTERGCLWLCPIMPALNGVVVGFD